MNAGRPWPRLLVPLLLFAGWLGGLVVARGQVQPFDPDSVASASGQFFVVRQGVAVPTGLNLALMSDTNLLQLKPSVLAVGAEHFKRTLWHELGLSPNAFWSGKIVISLYPAWSADDTVTIVSEPFLDHWNYQVKLPDRLSQARFARALSGVLLLELANRQLPRGGHSAEVPAWLVDGLARQVLAANADSLLLSAPMKRGEALLITRVNQSQRGLDSLVAARQVLQNGRPLTFDQLSWPINEQMNGWDGGVYYASAQLFLSELLKLKDGPAKLRAMLFELPTCLNWQTAFYHAFAADFQRPLDVEKWWALRTITFEQRDPGPRWTIDVSIARLEELLSVPVNYRGESNALPTHAEMSLQKALQSLAPEEREEVIRAKARDLALAEIRLAPPFGRLADAYRVTLAGFLGDLRKTQVSVVNKHGVPPSTGTSIREAVGRLDALDARRRDAEIQLFASLPGKSSAAILSPPRAGP